MKVTESQLQDLLDLSIAERNLNLAKNEAIKLQNSAEVAELRKRALENSAAVLEASNQVDNLQSSLRRNQEDTQLVEQRVTRDQLRLEQASNPKDVQGLQNELKTLNNRRSDLDDISLQIMDEIAIAEVSLAEAKAERVRTQAELDALVASVNQEIAKLASGAELESATCSKLVTRLPADLLAEYRAKSTRGQGVGKLLVRECGACRLTLTSSDFERIQNAAKDEIVYCPECQAILVR